MIVDVRLTQAHSRAEREAAMEMVREIPRGTRLMTVAADRGQDRREFVYQLMEMKVTPQIAENRNGRSSAVARRTTRHEDYWISQRRQWLVEECCGWAKVVAGLRKVTLRGWDKVGWPFTLAAAAHDLVRIRNLMATTA